MPAIEEPPGPVPLSQYAAEAGRPRLSWRRGAALAGIGLVAIVAGITYFGQRAHSPAAPPVPLTIGIQPMGEPMPSFSGFGSFTFPAIIVGDGTAMYGCVFRNGADYSTGAQADDVMQRAAVLEYERMSIREAYRTRTMGTLVSTGRTPAPMGCYIMRSIDWSAPPDRP